MGFPWHGEERAWQGGSGFGEETQLADSGGSGYSGFGAVLVEGVGVDELGHEGASDFLTAEDGSLDERLKGKLVDWNCHEKMDTRVMRPWRPVVRTSSRTPLG